MALTGASRDSREREGLTFWFPFLTGAVSAVQRFSVDDYDAAKIN